MKQYKNNFNKHTLKNNRTNQWHSDCSNSRKSCKRKWYSKSKKEILQRISERQDNRVAAEPGQREADRDGLSETADGPGGEDRTVGRQNTVDADQQHQLQEIGPKSQTPGLLEKHQNQSFHRPDCISTFLF